MLVIRDEQLTRKLQQIAELEGRSVEEVVESMVDQYSAKETAEAARPHRSEAVKRVRYKVFAMARQYWESVGDTQKAAMTDEELDEEFGEFDEEGVPRLKNELKSKEPPAGSLAYAAMIAQAGDLRSGKPDLARRSREILETHFADDISDRMRREDAGERSPC